MDESPAAGPQASEAGLEASVLVLNRYYTPIRVVAARRAFCLLYTDHAEAVDQEEGQFASFDLDAWLLFSNQRVHQPLDGEQFVRTPQWQVMVPRVIRLKVYDKVPRIEVRFNRRSLLSRDGNRCQYCGRKLPASQLSIDHLLPKSRGGRSDWMNMVVACNPCNTRKGGRLPSEAGMKLLRPPSIPKRNPLVVDKVRQPRYALWRCFLGEKYRE